MKLTAAGTALSALAILSAAAQPPNVTNTEGVICCPLPPGNNPWILTIDTVVSIVYNTGMAGLQTIAIVISVKQYRALMRVTAGKNVLHTKKKIN
ncbi:hypothetical protein AOQ84DRAFT_142990 [Glonium stellatum]|uniref:Uncharacterized protein n=1 Tax=Glonium stellatum TaxID=574774 RepID=A0A8E2F9W2_9PEZI|nr:hypothetical protein AOQ84DRAFT_142990 [Glonium stellatum]